LLLAFSFAFGFQLYFMALVLHFSSGLTFWLCFYVLALPGFRFAAFFGV
jgi:hypothetical protein